MHFCLQEASVSDLVIQLIEKLADNPASYLLESWITSQLQMTSPEVPSGTAQRFRNRLLHVAIETKLFPVTEALLIAGA
jgi:hypothetical protein